MMATWQKMTCLQCHIAKLHLCLNAFYHSLSEGIICFCYGKKVKSIDFVCMLLPFSVSGSF